MTEHRFGRRSPSSWDHVSKYGLADHANIVIPANVETTLPFHPDLKRAYDQDGKNACVGASEAQQQAWFNSQRNGDEFASILGYDWIWLWERAKAVDEFNDTNPGDNNGTSVRAGFDVLRTMGLATLTRKGRERRQPKPIADAGIESNYWITSVDQGRAIVALGRPFICGTLFTVAMENPQPKDGHFRMPEHEDFRHIAGGHAWGVYGALDSRQCFLMPNTWGLKWPDPSGKELFAEVPYSLMAQLLDRDGELGVAVDRATAALLGLRPVGGAA